MLDGQSIGDGRFSLSVYPASQPVYMELIRNGSIAKIMETGATVRTAFCGPCFGAGDVPANNAFSIRHSTRNFPNREGSKVNNGQIASVALMDARSIAATALNKGRLTAATDIDVNFTKPKYYFDSHIYEKRVYNGVGKADPSVEIQFGPNIKDWPSMVPLTDNILLKVVSEIHDPVTTTDELFRLVKHHHSVPILLVLLSSRFPERIQSMLDVLRRFVQQKKHVRMESVHVRQMMR